MATKTQDDASEAPARPEFHLVVVHPFGEYRRGDPITDAAEIAAVMGGENSHHVHKTIPQ